MIPLAIGLGILGLLAMRRAFAVATGLQSVHDDREREQLASFVVGCGGPP